MTSYFVNGIDETLFSEGVFGDMRTLIQREVDFRSELLANKPKIFDGTDDQNPQSAGIRTF